jgi:hypothetical protein
MTPRRCYRACLVGLAVTGVTVCAPTHAQVREPVTAQELLVSPARFDGRVVTLAGRVSNVRLEVRSGRPSYTLLVDDGTQLMTVVAPGGPRCQSGQSVTVEGWFRASRDPSDRSHIEAISVTCE